MTNDSGKRAVEEEILALHRGWNEANTVADSDWLRRHIAGGGRDRYVMFNHYRSNFYGQDGIVRLWDHLRETARAAGALEKPAILEDVEVRTWVGEDMATVAALTRTVIDFGDAAEELGGNVDGVIRQTEVWQRIDGEWKMVHYHCSDHAPGILGGE